MALIYETPVHLKSTASLDRNFGKFFGTTMTNTSNPRKKPARPASPLIVRLDEESKACLTRAAQLRRVSVSDYVRTVTVAQARKEVAAAGQQTIALTPDKQLEFWIALQQPVRRTAAQKKLGAIMRGEA